MSIELLPAEDLRDIPQTLQHHWLSSIATTTAQVFVLVKKNSFSFGFGKFTGMLFLRTLELY